MALKKFNSPFRLGAYENPEMAVDDQSGQIVMAGFKSFANSIASAKPKQKEEDDDKEKEEAAKNKKNE